MDKKIAIITGASKGIGSALTLEFQKQGFFVVGISRSEPKSALDHWIQGDITNKAEIDRITTLINTNYPQIDVLVNNTGRGLYDTWLNTDLDDLRNMFELNFYSMIALSQKLFPLLTERKGSIINTSSVAGYMPVACMGGYCASKSAVNQFSHTLGIELKPFGLNVLNVVVGRTSTGFSDGCTGEKVPPPSPGASPGPEKLVKAIFKAYNKRKRELIFPGWYRWVFKLIRIVPNWYANQNIKRWKLADEQTDNNQSTEPNQ